MIVWHLAYDLVYARWAANARDVQTINAADDADGGMTMRHLIAVFLGPAVVAGVVGCSSGADSGSTAANQSPSIDSELPEKPTGDIASSLQDRFAGDDRRVESNSNATASRELPASKERAGKPDDESPPPSFSQIVDVIDLRSVALPRAATLPRRLAGFYSCVAGISAEDAKSFLHEQLIAMGCEEVSSEYDEQNEYYTDRYEKDGYLLRAHASKQQPSFGRSVQSSLVILNEGRLEVHELPRIGDAEPKKSTKSSVSFETAASVADAIEQLRPILAEVGWREYGEENPTALDDLRIVGFFNDGHKLQVILYGPGYIDGNEKTLVKYHMGVRNFELPEPPGAKNLVLNDIEGTLTCKSSVPLNDAVSFYRARFRDLGWEQNEKFGHVDDDSVTLVYKRGVDSTWVELVQEDDALDVKLKGLTN